MLGHELADGGPGLRRAHRDVRWALRGLAGSHGGPGRVLAPVGRGALAHTVLGNARHQGTDLDRGSFRRENLQSPRRLRRDLHGGLVGFKLEERLVAPDALAVLLVPARDHATGDRLAEVGNADLQRHHALSPPGARAAATSASSSLWCVA